MNLPQESWVPFRETSVCARRKWERSWRLPERELQGEGERRTGVASGRGALGRRVGAGLGHITAPGGAEASASEEFRAQTGNGWILERSWLSEISGFLSP